MYIWSYIFFYLCIHSLLVIILAIFASSKKALEEYYLQLFDKSIYPNYNQEFLDQMAYLNIGMIYLFWIGLFVAIILEVRSFIKNK